MPCYLVITIEIKDMSAAKIALDELGLQVNRDYVINGEVLTLYSKQFEGLVKQRYGVVKSEREARRKGYRTQRQTNQENEIVLVLTR